MGINLGSSAVTLYLGDQAVNACLGETLLTPEPTVPEAPTGLAGYEGTGLYWTAPANGGAAITGYKVYVSDEGQELVDVDVTDLGTFVIPSQKGGDVQWASNGSVYGGDLVWQVSAVNSVGEGPKSEPPLAYGLA